MSSKNAIVLEKLSKKYTLYEKPIDRLLQMLPWNKSKSLGKTFWALKDISLKVKHGEVIGVVGQNGAGKSTLLQLVCNTLTPSEGKLSINGKIAALLELGSGFNPEFSGRENIFMAAAIAGLSHEEAKQKYDQIVDFSGINDFIDDLIIVMFE